MRRSRVKTHRRVQSRSSPRLRRDRSAPNKRAVRLLALHHQGRQYRRHAGPRAKLPRVRRRWRGDPDFWLRGFQAEMFLSHSHHDKRLTVRIAKELRRHGMAAWYSEKRHLVGAQQWLDQIGLALKRCDWFAVVLTPEAIGVNVGERAKCHCGVDRVAKYNGRIVPLFAKDCVL